MACLGNPLSEEYVSGGISYQTFERGPLRWREGEYIAMVPLGTRLAERYNESMTPRLRGTIPRYDESLFVAPLATPAWDVAPPAPSWWSRGGGVVEPAGALGLRRWHGRPQHVRQHWPGKGPHTDRTLFDYQ